MATAIHYVMYFRKQLKSAELPDTLSFGKIRLTVQTMYYVAFDLGSAVAAASTHVSKLGVC